MKDDAQFEDRLRRQPLKPIPGEWREDILRQAARAGETRSATLTSTPSLFETLKCRLAGLFLPAPRAWAGLAIVWVFIVVMNLSGGQPPTTSAMAATVPVAQTRLALKQKQLLLAELAGRSETRPSVEPRKMPPGPRSQRRAETTVV